MAIFQGALLGVLAGVQVQAATAPDPAEKVDQGLKVNAPAQVEAPPERSRADQLRELVCDAAERVDKNQKRLALEKEYAKVGGMLDKEKVYRASRGIVEGRREGREAMKAFKEETGKEFGGADLMKCPYFSE